MFIEQEKRDGDDAGHGEFSQCKGGQECEEKDQHDEMEGARDPEGRADSAVAGDGMQSGIAVKFEILTGIENIEAGDPEGDRGGEEQNARVEGAANGDPRGGGGDAKSEAEDEVSKPRKALGVGVEQQDGERDGGKPKSEPIQLGSGQDEDRAGDNDEGGDKCGRQMAGGECASESAGIGSVNGRISEAIESHGGRAAREHGDHDPKELMGAGKAGGSQHGSAEGKRESEDGVLPFDHFESDAEVVKDGHRKIVRHAAGLSS